MLMILFGFIIWRVSAPFEQSHLIYTVCILPIFCFHILHVVALFEQSHPDLHCLQIMLVWPLGLKELNHAHVIIMFSSYCVFFSPCEQSHLDLHCLQILVFWPLWSKGLNHAHVILCFNYTACICSL